MEKEQLLCIESKVGYITSVPVTRCRTSILKERILRSIAFANTGSSEVIDVEGLL